MLGLCAALIVAAAMVIVGVVVVVLVSLKQVTAPGPPPAMKIRIGMTDRPCAELDLPQEFRGQPHANDLTGK